MVDAQLTDRELLEEELRLEEELLSRKKGRQIDRYNATAQDR